ncbi:MAG: molybdopterin-dependent oxidoreductase, partial [Chloroflexi bacterium]|nr:molybdopterin-dependent oxidoreductase [Chloroflexota bacterium]
VVITLSGVWSFIWISGGWAVEIHRIAAWVLLALIPWKIGISWRSLKRGLGKRADRNIVIVVSLVLAALTFVIILLGLLWTWQIGPQTFRGPRLLWWHWILGFVMIVPLAIHVWRRWPKPKQEDFTTRRSALRMIGLLVAGIVGWRVAETLAEARNPEETPRLITGSRLAGEFSGNDFPITSEPKPSIDLDTWRLLIAGAVARPFELSQAGLARYPYHEYEAKLDCTNGWWTIQRWGGVPLELLLNEAQMNANVIAIRMTSVTGYSQVFSLKEAGQILVSTHVGDEPLSEWHGFPARAVVPSRRGWFWVKWLSEIKAMDSWDEILVHPFTIR